MNKKIEFGCDYLHVMRNLESWREKEEFDPRADAIARLFLLQWDFSVEEIDEANHLYLDRVNGKSLDDDAKVTERLIAFVKEDKAATERLVIELVAVGAVDDHVTEGEGNFVRSFRDRLDLRPSEFNVLIKKGVDWAHALAFVGSEYADAKLIHK